MDGLNNLEPQELYQKILDGKIRRFPTYKTRPYHVQLQINGKNKVLGKFSDVHEAGRFAEEMRQKYYGEFAGKS